MNLCRNFFPAIDIFRIFFPFMLFVCFCCSFVFVCLFVCFFLCPTKENASYIPQFFSSLTQSFSMRIHDSISRFQRTGWHFTCQSPCKSSAHRCHNLLLPHCNKRSIVSKNRTLSGGVFDAPLKLC